MRNLISRNCLCSVRAIFLHVFCYLYFILFLLFLPTPLPHCSFISVFFLLLVFLFLLIFLFIDGRWFRSEIGRNGLLLSGQPGVVSFWGRSGICVRARSRNLSSSRRGLRRASCETPRFSFTGQFSSARDHFVPRARCINRTCGASLIKLIRWLTSIRLVVSRIVKRAVT